MNASEQPSDHGHSRIAGWGCCIFSLAALLILVGQIVFSVVTYSLLPLVIILVIQVATTGATLHW
jgi:hypothetical protein